MLPRKQMRVFPALELPDQIIHHCISMQEELSTSLRKLGITYRTINPDRLHITLVAPMHIDEDQLSQITKALALIKLNPCTIKTSKLYYNQRSNLIWLSICR